MTIKNMSHLIKLFTAFFLCFLAVNISLYAEKALPSGITIHHLDNGMEVLLIENRALPMVGVNVVIKTGSAYETFSSSGMSHMLEHLLFNGTTKRTQKQLYDEVDLIGGYNNANTGAFYTNFMMVTPAEHIIKGMEIQADMLFNSTIPEKKFAKEKGIVLEEIAQGFKRSARQREHNLKSVLFKGHSISLPTPGTYATIESLSSTAVKQYYKNNYVPNNMILSAIGNFETEKFLQQIKKIYGRIKPGKIIRPQSSELNTGFLGLKKNYPQNKIAFHRSFSAKKPEVNLVYKLPINPTPGFFEVLEESLSSRIKDLEKSLTKEFPKKFKYLKFKLWLYPQVNYLVLRVGLLQKNNYNPLLTRMMDHMTSLNFSLPREVIEALVASNKTNFLKTLEKPHMFGILNAGTFAVRGIDGVLSAFSPETYYTAAKELEDFKLNEKPLLIHHHPTTTEAGEQDKISVTTTFSDFASGFTLIVKKNSVSQLLAIHYLFKHKATFNSKYGKDAAKILHHCFGLRLKTEKNKKISSKFGLTFKVNDNPYIPMDNIYLHPDFGYIRAEGLADDLEGAISYLNEQMLNFTPSRDEFMMAERSFSNAMADRRSAAQKLFQDTYKKLVEKFPVKPDAAQKITYENLLALAKEYFQPRNMIIAVVSPEDPDSIKRRFKEFGGAKALNNPLQMDALQNTLILLHKPVIVEKKGGGAQSFIFWGYVKNFQAEEKAALKALSLLLAEKIVFQIREKQGMAYGMRAGIDIKKDRALFYVRLGSRPENIKTLKTQLPGFFKAELLADIKEQELKKAINMYLGRMQFRRLSSINQAYYLSHSLYFHGDINADNLFLDRLKKVSLADVLKMAHKYLKPENPISVVVH
ncbi:M16 family metallopeptidase [Candidatus Riflebacteria bacterium]